MEIWKYNINITKCFKIHHYAYHYTSQIVHQVLDYVK